MFVIQLFIAVILLLAIASLLWLILVRSLKQERISNPELAFISVLIAVRNEERNLELLFDALEKIDYPEDQWEILFGNDESEDATREMLQIFCSKHKNASFLDISPSEKQKAKANVLMQLAEKAKGDFFYFTDADMRPNPDILYRYQEYFTESRAGITGVTLPKGKTLMQIFQKIDWILALGMAEKAEALGHQTTAMGNNMMLRREDYFAVGGYEELPISVVEDFTLYKSIVSTKREFPLIIHADLLSFTEPLANISQLLKQRKRWMSGGMELSWFLKSVLLFQGLYYPALIALLVLNPYLGIVFFIIKATLQGFFVQRNLLRLRQELPFTQYFFYEIYNSVFTSLLLVFYLLPIRIDWKKRKYGNY